MGAGQTKSLISEEYVKSSHPYFQKALVIDEFNSKTVRVEFSLQKADHEKWAKVICIKSRYVNIEYLYLPEKTGFADSNEICSNTGTSVNIYPYYPYVLAEQIALRKIEKAYFKEIELWYLLFAISSAAIQMKQLDSRLGNISPYYVLINEEKLIKVGNILSIPNEKDGFLKFRDDLSSRSNYYLPPEDVYEAKSNAISNKYNQKTQVFSIGATVMCAGILEDLKKVYPETQTTFLEEEFQSKRYQWANHPNYSELFKSIILNLINSNPENRMSLRQLWSFLQSHQKDIRERTSLMIVQPPFLKQNSINHSRAKGK